MREAKVGMTLRGGNFDGGSDVRVTAFFVTRIYCGGCVAVGGAVSDRGVGVQSARVQTRVDF
jgi:hypothetical protein